jgi:hypothetical protein
MELFWNAASHLAAIAEILAYRIGRHVGAEFKTATVSSLAGLPPTPKLSAGEG